MIFFSTRFERGASYSNNSISISGKFSFFLKRTLLAAMIVFSAGDIMAQCQLSPSVGSTVPITISVNNSCQATLNAASLTPFVSTTPPPIGCVLYIDADPGAGVSLVMNLVLTLGGSPGAGIYGVYSDDDGVVDINTTGPVFVNVTLLDNTFPTLGALASPVNANTNADGAGNCSVAINMPTPSWTENCVNSTTWAITYTAGSPAPASLPSNESYTFGTLPGGWPMGGGSLNRTFFSSTVGTPGRTIVTFKVTDGAGQSAETSITVQITDNENPMVTCPGSLNVFTNNDASPQNCTFTVSNNALNASASDNCTVNTLTHNFGAAPSNTTLNGASFPIGLTNVIWSVTDVAGNFNNCNFNVTVIDNTSPEISCPSNVTVNTDPNVCTATNIPGIAMTQAGFNNPALLPLSPGQSYDNCDNSLFTQYSYTGPTSSGGLVAGNNAGINVFSLGTYTINYRVTDDAANNRQCNFSLTVQDVQPPNSITCPATINTTTLTGQCENTVTWTPPAVPIDNCTGTVVLTVDAEDESGNPVTVLTANTFGCVSSTQFSGTFAPGAWTTDLNGGNGSIDVSVAPNEIRLFEAVNPSAANTEFEIVIPYSGILTFSYFYNAANGSGDQFQYTINGVATSIVGGNSNEFGAISLPVLSGQVFGFRQNSNGNGSQVETRVNGLVFTCSQGSFATFPGGTNIVTYTATDANGNTTTCTFNVNVADTEVPVAICQNIAVNAGATVQAVNINSGSTDNCGIVTYGISANNGGPFTPSVVVGCANTTLYLQVTDEDNNTATCASTITVIDATTPSIVCPSNVNTNTAAGVCTATLNLAPASVTDNCTPSGSIVVTHNTTGVTSISGPGNITGGVFNKGITNVTFTATDGASLNTSCTFSVNVTDNEAPVQSGGQANGSTITQNAGAGQCSALVNWTPPTFTDNCGPVNVVSTHTPPSTFPAGPTIVTYTATDLSGNSKVVSFTVNVVDNSGPLAQCKDITVNLDNSGSVSVNGSQIDAGSQDDCGIASRKISKDGGLNFFDPITFNCNELGVNSVILQVADANNNTAECNANITVQDITDPNAICHNISVNLSSVNPGTVTIFANNGNPAVSVDFGSTDNCSIVTYEIAVDGGSFGPSYTFDCSDDGVHIVVLRVTDQSGNDATCQASVTVNDVTFPVITCPANVVIGTSLGGSGDCNGTYTWTNPIPTDNCNIVSYTVTANSSTVSVVGNTLISRTFTKSGSPHTVVYTVTDENNNVTTCSFTVGVVDDENPTITCAASGTRGIADDGITGDCLYEVQGSEFDPTAFNDNCGVLLVTNNYNGQATLNGELLGIGTYNITWTVTDVNSLTNTCIMSITVVDDEVPVFNYCPTNIVLPSINNNCSNLASWSRPNFFFSDIFDCDNMLDVVEEISDNGVQQSVDLNFPFDYFGLPNNPLVQVPVGITTVTYIATDNFNNTSSCSFTITVLDIQAPLITCPGSQSLGTICANGTVPTYQPVAVTDNCSDYTVTQSPAAGVLLGSLPGITPAAGQSFTVTLTATDDNPDSLSSSCSFSVILTDSQNPIPTVAGATLPPIDTTCGSYVVTAPTATDCGQVIYGIPTPSGTPIGGTPPQYIYTTGFYNVIWTYIDNQNNTSSQLQSITITDDTNPPVALCKNHILNLNGSSSASINTSHINNGSYDNCGPVTVSLSNTLFTCLNVGLNTVVLTVTDGSQLVSTCSATVTVVDNVAPVLNNVPNDITLSCSQTIPAVASVTASDACGATVTFNQTSNQTATGCGHYSYTIVRTWTATDGSNTVTDSQVITVIDNTAPVFTGLPPTMTVNTSLSAITCSAAVSLTVSATDCAPANQLTFTNNAPFGNGTTSINGTYNVGTYNITFSVTDPCGNTRTQVLVLHVVDVTPPTPLCVNSITVPLNGAGTLNLIPTAVNNGSYDNCPGTLTYSLNPSMFDCSDAGTTIPVVLTVTDSMGNSAFCTTNLEIQENTLPVITSCPSNITVSCGVSLDPDVNLSLGIPTATDNCDSLSIDYVDEFSNGPNTYCGDYRRTWTVTDNAGNTRVCTQYISVEDLVAPSLPAAPANITLECGATVPAPAVLTATDNCDSNVPVDYVQVVTNTACGGYNQTLLRTWTATDDCGNAVTRTQVITIQDTQAPQMTFVPSTLTAYTNASGGNNCYASVSMNISSLIQDCVPVANLIITNNAPFGNGSNNASGNYPPGTYVITFTAIDLCGNIGTKTVTLTVIDNNIPVAQCHPTQAVTLGNNGQGVVAAASINNGSYDNCGTLTNIVLAPNVFDCGDLGQNIVTLTVTDASGNTNTCTSVVTVSSDNPALNLNLTMSSTTTTFFGANNGTATVSVTGGSGSYTYDWSNDGPESPDNDGTSIGGLGGGVYSVTVSDVLSGCQAVGSVTVAEGNVVAFNIGTASGTPGTIVNVPVSVQYFNNIGAFQFTINLSNPAVGSILGASGFNLPGLSNANFNVINATTLGVAWLSVNPMGNSVGQNVVIFNVQVQLAGTPGINSPVVLTDTPVDFEVNQIIGGLLTLVPSTNTDGSVSITSFNTVQVEGDILKPNGSPVCNVTVNLTGSSTGSIVTNSSGHYAFSAAVPGNVKVTPFKDIFRTNGVSVADLFFMQQVILTNDNFDFPWQFVAADVNRSGFVSTIDIVELQYMILQPSLNFSNNTSWRFVDADFVLPANPLGIYLPDSIVYNPLTLPQLDGDFVAIKIGDPTGNANPDCTMFTAGDDRNEDQPLVFEVDDRVIIAGETFEVIFKSKGFSDLIGYQTTLKFDANTIELQEAKGAELEGLDGEKFALNNKDQGLMTTLWFGNEPTSLNDGTALFTMTFKAKTSGNKLSEILSFGSDITYAEAIDAQGNVADMQIAFTEPVNNNGFELFQNQPNPFNAATTIGFNMPESGNAILTIFDISGKVVKVIDADYSKGYHEVSIGVQELNGTGAYYYQLETADNIASKKMIQVR